MNIALLPLPPVAQTMHASIRLGMPHLSLNGLSESWLLKELGDRHWMMLARLAGRAVPDFRDRDGTPVYAAFCAVLLRETNLAMFAEHDRIEIVSDIGRVSRTQFVSTHRLMRDGVDAGQIQLSSVFVKRREAGRNRSIARVVLDDCAAPVEGTRFSRVSQLTAAMRAGDWTEHLGFRRSEAGTMACLGISPNPAQDFNGAGFLYFAAFQAFAERAEWELLAPDPCFSTTTRSIFYHGNAEVGERVVVTLRAVRQGASELAHWFTIVRENDGTRMADIFTVKRPG